MKYTIGLLIALTLTACDTSKRVVDVQSKIKVDTIYSFRAEDGTVCTAVGAAARGVKRGDLWNCMW